MLVELHVRDLGVIADLTVAFGPGMTAITGETGAGKTLVVEAIELLVGERADPLLVRHGADEAWVEGRFERDGVETVLARAIPRAGRSRAYVGGRMATASELAEVGRALVDLHGQHAHQSLLSPRVQRASLDRFGGVDLVPLAAARSRLGAADGALEAIGGDARTRAREVDLLRFQLADLAAAGLGPADEDEALEEEEDRLEGATGHVDAGLRALASLASDAGDDGAGGVGAAEAVGRALGALGGHRPYAGIEARMRAVEAELADLSAEVRRLAESIDLDPARLEAVRSRRRQISELRRKYGKELGRTDAQGTPAGRLSEVLEYRREAEARLADLERHEERVRELEAERESAAVAVAAAAAVVAEARRAAAPRLAASVEGHLQSLAMAGARFAVRVDGDGPADGVTFCLGANVGEASLPLSRVASGGELARTMLATRLVFNEQGFNEQGFNEQGFNEQGFNEHGPAGASVPGGPDCLVFDEVDAGVGGEAAGSVGRALSALASGYQVLVVTHLPQVAAFADHQMVVAKAEVGGRSVASARPVQDADRVVELSRMLSGQPSSATAQDHARELLAAASQERAAVGSGLS